MKTALNMWLSAAMVMVTLSLCLESRANVCCVDGLYCLAIEPELCDQLGGTSAELDDGNDSCAAWTEGPCANVDTGMLPPVGAEGGFGHDADMEFVAGHVRHVVVGAPEAAGTRGTASVIEWVVGSGGGAWVPDTSFVFDTSVLNPGDRAGTSVSSDGDWVAIGIPGRREVRLFALQNDLWQERQTVVPLGDGVADEGFGSKIVLSGSTLFVGAPDADSGAGRVSVFTLNEGVEQDPWEFTQHLGLGAGLTNGFGKAMDVDGVEGRAIIGAPVGDGGAYSVQRLDGVWVITKDLSVDLPTSYGELGFEIELVGEYAYIANPLINVTGTTLGVVWAYLWEEDEGADGGLSDFSMITFVAPPDGATGTQFGAALSLQPGILLVGSPNEDGVGAVHAYTYPGDTSQMIGLSWHSRTMGTTPDDRFGTTLTAGWTDGIAGGLALSGSPGATSGAGRVDPIALGDVGSTDSTSRPPYEFAAMIDAGGGAAPQQIDHAGDWAIAGWPNHPGGNGGIRLFKHDGTTWSPIGDMLAGTVEGFGRSIAMLDGVAAIGSPNENGSGLVHMFSYSDAGLTPLTTLDPGGSALSRVGASVALAANPSGDMLLAAGAPAIDIVDEHTTPDGPGAVYYYGRLAGSTNWFLHSLEIEPALDPATWSGLGYDLEAVWYQDEFQIISGQPCFQIPGEEVSGSIAHMRGTLSDPFIAFISTVNIGEGGRLFGTSVGLAGNTLAVGAPGLHPNAPYGVIHVFVDFFGGLEQATSFMLSPNDEEFTVYNARYGSSVDVSVVDGRLNVAAAMPEFTLASIGGGAPGAIDLYAYVLEDDGNPIMKRQARIMPRAGMFADDFGGSLSFIDGQLLFANGPTNQSDGQLSPSFAALTMQSRSYWLNPAGGDDDQSYFWSVPPAPGDTVVFSLLESTLYYVGLNTVDSVAIEVRYDSPILSRFGFGGRPGRGSDPAPTLTSLDVGSDADIRTASVLLSGLFNFTDFVRVGGSQNNESGGLHLFGASQMLSSSYTQKSNGALMLSLTSNTNTTTPFLGSGTIDLQGSLAINMDSTTIDNLVVGQKIKLLETPTPPGDDARFDLAVLPGLPNDMALTINYGSLGRGSNWNVYAEVVSLSGLLGFGDPNSVPVAGDPVDVEIADLTGDGADEICILFGGEPGTLSVFENDGVGGVVQQLTLSVNDNPTGLTSGDFDGDGTTDLAYASLGSSDPLVNDSVVILHNEDLDLGNGFENPYAHSLSGAPTCLTAINWDDVEPNDLVVGLALAADSTTGYPGAWQILLGTNSARAREVVDGPIKYIPGVPIDVDPKPDEDEAPKDADARFIGSTSLGQVDVGKRTLLRRGGTIDVDSYAVGADLQGLATGDFNGDGRFDIAAVSALNNQLGVLLADTTTSSGFTGAIYVSPGTLPRGLVCIDFDLDGNIDLATIATDTTGVRGVRVLQNDGNLIFTAVETATGESPSLIEVGDVSGNGVTELVTITAGTVRGAGGSQLSLRTVADVIACTGDIDGNAMVDVLDLLAVIAVWGDCSGCAADINADGTVDVLDLLAVIAAWGDCVS